MEERLVAFAAAEPRIKETREKAVLSSSHGPHLRPVGALNCVTLHNTKQRTRYRLYQLLGFDAV
jgi:hypothetical protein